MSFPEFMRNFPEIDLPGTGTEFFASAIKSQEGIVAFFSFPEQYILPPHKHGVQWGVVVSGEIELDIGGETNTYKSGDTYLIPADVEHSAVCKAGTKIIDVFEDASRHKLR